MPLTLPRNFPATLVAIGMAIAAPQTAVAGEFKVRDAVPVDLSDDSDVLTAHADLPPAGAGEVDDACRAAARESNKGEPGTIVVCSHNGDGTSQRVPPSESVDNSTRTGALTPPDVSGLPGCLGPCVKIRFGHVPPPVLMIDLAALPEAPKGSDAWKIAQGIMRAP